MIPTTAIRNGRGVRGSFCNDEAGIGSEYRWPRPAEHQGGLLRNLRKLFCVDIAASWHTTCAPVGLEEILRPRACYKTWIIWASAESPAVLHSCMNAIRNSAAPIPAKCLLDLPLARIGSTRSDRSASIATMPGGACKYEATQERTPTRQPVSDPSLRMHLTKQFIMA